MALLLWVIIQKEVDVNSVGVLLIHKLQDAEPHIHLMTDSVPQMALLQRVRISHVRTLDTMFFKFSGSECMISSNSAN